MNVAANLVFRRISRPYLSHLFLLIQNYSTVSQEVVGSAESLRPGLSTVKKKQKFPFAKNLFLGKFDHDVLTYPEVLEKERLQTLNELVAPVERFFSDGDFFLSINEADPSLPLHQFLN
jgi:hypothetical protein